MADRVRSYSRRGPGGKTVRVNQHTRASRPRKALVSPRHAWQLAKRARKASRKKKTVLACVLGGLAVVELTTWGLLDTAGKLLTVFAFGAFLAAGLAMAATGREQ